MAKDRSDKLAPPQSGGHAVLARGPPRAPGDFPVVGIGASAGGLDACRKFLSGLARKTRMAFILIQHSDPDHDTVTVDQLSGYTTMTVRHAADGMLLEADQFYVIPPGTYLSVARGALHLSRPQVEQGARLLFDVMLHSLAEEYADHAVCLVLSGTGADGSLGLKAIKRKGGLVVAQDPDEAGYDGMPRSAIRTGDVDLVLSAAKIPEALAQYNRRLDIAQTRKGLRGGQMQHAASGELSASQNELQSLNDELTAANSQLQQDLRTANRKTQMANTAQARFTAAAGHDLRQPLQMLTLLQGQLAKSVEGDAGQKLLAQFDETLGAMSGILSGLLTTHQTASATRAPAPDRQWPYMDDGAGEQTSRTGAILVIEHDPQLREILKYLLTAEGHHTVVAPDGAAALELVAGGSVRPDLILCDYNLPNGMDGIAVSAKLREKLRRRIPVIVLTGDTSAGLLREFAGPDCVQLCKPMKPDELMQVIQQLLPMSQSAGDARVIRVPEAADIDGKPVIYVVDDNAHLREAMRAVLEDSGRAVETYESCEAFLETYRPGREACLVIDAYLPGMKGLELLQQIKESGHRLPAIMITGNSDVHMAVAAMKAGASDFIEKPIGHIELFASIDRAIEQSQDASKLSGWRQTAAGHLSGLTPREHEVLELVLAGHPSKNIALDLGISQRTVENHRAAIMKKTGSKSLPALARFALAASWPSADEPRAPSALPVAGSAPKAGK